MPCVILHNMLRTYQGVADRLPTPANDVAATVCALGELQESFDGGQTSKRTTERLLQSRWGFGWAAGQDLRCVNQQPWGRKR